MAQFQIQEPEALQCKLGYSQVPHYWLGFSFLRNLCLISDFQTLLLFFSCCLCLQGQTPLKENGFIFITMGFQKRAVINVYIKSSIFYYTLLFF